MTKEYKQTNKILSLEVRLHASYVNNHIQVKRMDVLELGI